MARVFGAMVAAGALLIAGFSACISGPQGPAGEAAPLSTDEPSGYPRVSGARAEATDLTRTTPATRLWLQRLEGWAAVDRSLAELLAPNEGSLELVRSHESSALESLAYRLPPGSHQGPLLVKAPPVRPASSKSR
jgi:hypothetical protein